jgi:predicted hydrocarbon binding protein
MAARAAPRALGYFAAGRAARRVLGGELRREAAVPVARIPATLAINATPDGSACGFYGAAFSELLRLLVGYEGGMVHVSCRAVGGDRCEWRAAPPDPRHH